MIGPRKVREAIADTSAAIKTALLLSVVALVGSIVALAVAILGGK